MIYEIANSMDNVEGIIMLWVEKYLNIPEKHKI